jgi:hypothetical protein
MEQQVVNNNDNQVQQPQTRTVPLNTVDIVQLKAIAYDLILTINQAQNNLNAINQELVSRSNAQNLGKQVNEFRPLENADSSVASSGVPTTLTPPQV